MPNDMIRFCMEKIAKYESSQGMHTFTAAQLSNEIICASRLSSVAIDGQIIRTILCGRPDVVVLGSGHYGLKV